MSATTTSRTRPALGPNGTTATTSTTAASPVALVAGALADVTTAARLLEPPPVPVTAPGERAAVVRLALAHVALSSGVLLLGREGGATSSAVALLPPGSHPDVAAMAWMAHLQLELPARPGGGAGRPPRGAHVLLPPRRPAAALELVRAALAGTEGLAVVAPVPGHPVVAAVLRAQGFTRGPAPGLLRRVS